MPHDKESFLSSLGVKEIPFAPSTLEVVDEAMYKFIKDEMNLFSTTNKGWRKVPVVWASAERAFQSKRGEEIRDKDGTLVLPIITIERVSVAKDLAKKGTIWGNIPPHPDHKGGVIPVARLLNQVKTSNFANADAAKKTGRINYPQKNEKIVYSTVTIPIPVYITINYTVTIRTEYQQQMNELTTPFVTRPGGVNYVIMKNQGHRYEGFIQQDFSQSNNLSDYTNEERKFETKIQIDVLGYLIGDDKNEKKPNFVYRENAVEVKMPRERLIMGEIPEHEMGSYYGLSGVPPMIPGGVHPTSPFFNNVPGVGAGSGGGGGGGALTPENFKNVFVESYAIREIPAGAIDGSNRTFTTQFNIKENTETVFFNGMLIYPAAGGNDNDYTLISANQFVLDIDYLPRTAEQKGGGEGVIDDIVLITYVRE